MGKLEARGKLNKYINLGWSQQTHRLYHYVGPSDNYACYILWRIGWKNSFIPFMGRNHTLSTRVVDKR